ncbi:MAG TPA: type 1 glutamine amidotransferase family protein [Spirochaetota bacterium]|nr:type 1 glutamine amidotransferase family protein [Spirochaetota bacterium]
MLKETECRTCYMYILDTLADWEIGFITAEINSGRYLDKGKEKVTLIKIGNTLEPVKTMGGIIITPDKDISNIEFKEGDLLVLPGADTWLEEKNQKILNIVSGVINKKVVIAAICGATIALAHKGLLNNRKHTSNDKDFLKMFCPEYSGSDYYVARPAVVDDNLITASGLAPMEFSYEVFKKTNIMKKSTLEAWYQLYKTKEAKYFFDLMESLK